jgi:hypothetical protein
MLPKKLSDGMNWLQSTDPDIRAFQERMISQGLKSPEQEQSIDRA